MKKISTSFILSLIAAIWAQLTSILPFGLFGAFTDVDSSTLQTTWYALMSVPFSVLLIASLILILLGCRELKARQPGFKRQFSLHLALYVVNVVLNAMPAVFWSSAGYFSIPFSEESPLYQLFYWVFSALRLAQAAFTLYVGWSLIQNIKLLGGGKAIGFRALRTAWLVNAAFTACMAVIGFADTIYTAVTQSENGLLGDIFPNLTAGNPSAYSITISIIDVLVIGVFTACIIRTAGKLNQSSPPEPEETAEQPVYDPGV